MRVHHLISELMKQPPNAMILVKDANRRGEKWMATPTIVTDSETGNIEILPMNI